MRANKRIRMTTEKARQIIDSLSIGAQELFTLSIPFGALPRAGTKEDAEVVDLPSAYELRRRWLIDIVRVDDEVFTFKYTARGAAAFRADCAESC